MASIGEDLERIGGSASASKPGRELVRRRRDFWLRLAAATLAGELSSWGRTRVLFREMISFEQRKWPTWVQLTEPPASASELERKLFEAFRLGAEIPQCAKTLHNCLKRNGSEDL